MNEAHLPLKVSHGTSLKIENSKKFNEILDEYGNLGEFPFLINKKFDLIYFSTPLNNHSKLELPNSETERFIKTHTQFHEKISKPQNQWVLFAQLNGKLIGTVLKIKEGKMATASVVTPILKGIWANLNKESLQYYSYLSTLEHNLHKVIHPNYQVQHSKVKCSNISTKLLESNLLINNPTSDNKTTRNTDFINFLRNTKKQNHKLSTYSYASFSMDTSTASRKKVETFVMSQHNKYSGLKTLKYCNRIKFNTKKMPKKQNKVVKPSNR